MKIYSLLERYNLHDSLLLGINYDKNESTLELVIDFAFWMQKGYKDDMPETGVVKLMFSGINSIELPDNIDFNMTSILDVETNGSTIDIMLINDLTDESDDIKIDANNVEMII